MFSRFCKTSYLGLCLCSFVREGTSENCGDENLFNTGLILIGAMCSVLKHRLTIEWDEPEMAGVNKEYFQTVYHLVQFKFS